MNVKVFDPMEGMVADSNSGGLPAGNYVGVFETAEYLPAQESDPMSGEGARKWAKIATRFQPRPRKSLDRLVIEATAEIPTV
mgnify:CR=1 FL=1